MAVNGTSAMGSVYNEVELDVGLQPSDLGKTAGEKSEVRGPEVRGPTLFPLLGIKH